MKMWGGGGPGILKSVFFFEKLGER